ncbi:MAG: hypothetical protein IJ033_03020 [Clostridia bacterium]|nr:hypothetical protein [Clostridia bacterium]
MAKKKLTREQKKMSHAQAVSGNGSKASPYYPTDYTVGKRNPKKEEKPMVQQVNVMTVKQWIGTLIVVCIPIVNIIALIAWCNKKNERVNPTKRNFAKAYLIVWVISLVVAIIFAVVIVVASMLLFPFPTTPDDAVDMLEEAGYVVETLEGENYVQVFAISEDGAGEDFVKIYYYDDATLAEEAFEALDAETEEELIYGLSDNAVYIGTDAAVDAINGNSLF